MRFGLNEKTIEQMNAVFAGYELILKVIIYGSRANGKFKTGSDIDLTIVAPGLSFSDLLKIENQLDDLLLPYKIDLSLYHKITDTDVIDHIRSVGEIFYQKK